MNKKERIKVGSASLPLYPWTDPKTGRDYWRWSWKDADGKWRYGTRAKKADAQEAARTQARTISNGMLDLSALTGNDADLVRQFIALKPTAADVQKLREWRAASAIPLSSAVANWHESKLAELHGKESPHLRNVHQWLEKLGKAFPDLTAAEITVEQIRAHIEGATKNPKTRRDARARVVALWKFARTHDLFDSAEADKLPNYRGGVDKSVDIWTVAEMRQLLTGVPEEFLPWLVLAAFSGLRSQEIAPARGTKPPLQWENIRRESEGGHIDLPAACSKVGKRRLLPITPTLGAWLDRINPPATGVICPRLPAEHVCGFIGNLVGGWRKNALRHSYGSYRAAGLKDLPALAIEMGTSVAMIEKHYREAVTESAAESYWSLTPSEVFRK